MNKRKILVITVFLAVVAFGLLISINSFFYVPAGWRSIEPSKGINNSSYYSLEYYFDKKTGSKYEIVLSELYTETLNESYQLFHSAESEEKGIWYINSNPNRVIRIDENVYDVLKTVLAGDDRTVFLGPIYEQYDNLFLCQNDSDASNYDPLVNSSIRDYFSELISYVENP